MNNSNLTFSHPSFAGKIGVGVEEITPPVDIYSRNWGAAPHDVAEGIHRPLWAKILTLQNADSNQPLVLVAVDLGWWKNAEDEYFLRGYLIEQLNLDPANVLLNLSHTHAGPALCRGDIHLTGGELITPYVEQVREALLRATKTALATAKQATLEWTSGWCNMAQNRDLKDPDKDRLVCGFNPGGPSDGTMLVGRAADETGKVFAVITNYACHPTTLAWQNKLISPDWCGAFHELVERHTGATSLFLQGASGELQPRESYTDDLSIVEAHGRELGYAVLSVLEGMQPPHTALEFSGVVESGAPLATWKRVPASPSTSLEARTMEVTLALKDLPGVEEIEAQLLASTDRVTQERLTRKKRVRTLIGDGDSFNLPVWIWNVGDVVFVAYREEAYAYLQQQVRAEFPGKAIVVMNLTNGSCGYLPPADLYDEDIYQVWQTPYERGGLEKLAGAVIEAIG